MFERPEPAIVLAHLAQVTQQGAREPGDAPYPRRPSCLPFSLLCRGGCSVHKLAQRVTQFTQSAAERIGCTAQRGTACGRQSAQVDAYAHSVALQVRAPHYYFVRHIAVQLLGQAIQGGLCCVNSPGYSEQHRIIGGQPQSTPAVKHETAAPLGMVNSLQDAQQPL